MLGVEGREEHKRIMRQIMQQEGTKEGRKTKKAMAERDLLQNDNGSWQHRKSSVCPL